jgi:outer membrane immunogenic protein
MCLVAFALVAAAGADDTNFKGFYVGASFGGAFSKSSARLTPDGTGNYFADSSVPAIAATGAQDLDPKGFTGGGTLGYNWRSQGGFVFGVEADMGILHLDSSATGSDVYPCCAPTGFTVTQNISTDWLFTARPRIGYATGNMLLYGTIGVAVTNLEYRGVWTDDFGPSSESGQFSEKKPGWALGGGLEYAVPNTHWSLKGEYLFLNFGDSKITSTNFENAGTPDPGTPFLHKADLRAHTLRFGANYRF